MDLPKLTDIEVSGKKVLVRMDLDVPENDDTRLEAGSETLDYLKEKNVRKYNSVLKKLGLKR